MEDKAHNIKKTGKSQYGHYLLTDEGNFIGTTEAVSNFLKDKVPCSVNITEHEGEGKSYKATKVKVLSSGNKEVPSSQNSQTPAVQTQPANAFKDERQESIIKQSCVARAIEWLKAHNESFEEKMPLTQQNIQQFAQMVKAILDNPNW